jgi:hydroxyacylglutathione hydrolase
LPRPDLLERAAKVANTMEVGARQLFKSLERFRTLPDWVQVWPGHGAGSACGKSLGAVPSTTVGYEKRFNWGVGTANEAEFVTMVLAGQPEPPLYFAEMKRINRDGPSILGGFPSPARGDVAALRGALERSVERTVVVVDTRSADAFAREHVVGTINIPLNKSFSTWAGWLIRYDVDIQVIVHDEASLHRAVRELAMIGLDRVSGWFDATIVGAWRAAGGATGTVTRMNVADLAPRLERGEVTVVDVRNRSEWEAGHLPGAIHIPGGHLEARFSEIPRDKPIVVQCQSGSRSSIAASVLQRLGRVDVANLSGGIVDWQASGYEVVRDAVPVGA